MIFMRYSPRLVRTLLPLVTAFVGSAGCGGTQSAASSDNDGAPGTSSTTVRMSFADTKDFYAAPFPSEHRRAASGGIDLAGFPNPDRVYLVDVIKGVVATEADGFGVSSGIFFSLTGAIDPERLPDFRASMKADAPVFLMDVDPASPEKLTRRPIVTRFAEDGGPFGAPNMLAMLPYQGLPLRAGTLYAAVVLRSLADRHGKPLGAPDSMAALAGGAGPEGISGATLAAYRAALDAVATAGVDVNAVAGFTVFRTGDPTSRFETVLGHALSQPLPHPAAPLALKRVYDDFCVFESTIEMPTYQGGVPPYAEEGGGWVFDSSGAPQVQAKETASFVVTLPRQPMPAAGFPTVITARAGMDGEGMESPLADKGPVQKTGGVPVLGTGPAAVYARAGFAGVMIDGPHTGLRNITKGDAQFLIFNIQNPTALRDNIRQFAVDLALQAHLLKDVSIDPSGCPGLTTEPGGPARFDQGKTAAFGFSMGATILPLSLAHEPLLRAAVLTGAGSSYIDNILYKEKPIATKGFAEVLLGYPGRSLELTELDPVLSLLQWGAEPADPPPYARHILRAPTPGAERHVLIVQGVVDHYILPPMANGTNLSIGVDLAGEAVDAKADELKAFLPFQDVADLAGLVKRDYPVTGNIEPSGAMPRTGVVVQHHEDGIEDGHVVLFQTEGPKYQMKCFLESFAKGVPTVPAPASRSDVCP